MNNPINDGGSAFPSEQGETQNNEWNQTYQPGMSLRDWFAGQALAGMMANPILLELHEDYAMTAKACMHFADAMLAERLKGGEE